MYCCWPDNVIIDHELMFGIIMEHSLHNEAIEQSIKKAKSILIQKIIQKVSFSSPNNSFGNVSFHKNISFEEHVVKINSGESSVAKFLLLLLTFIS